MSSSLYHVKRPPRIVHFLGLIGLEVREFWNVPAWMEIDMEAAIRMKKELRMDGKAITVYPIIVRAIAQAIREFLPKYPEMNAMRTGFRARKVIYFNEINTAVTCASTFDGESVFYLCHVRNADQKDLLEISNELRAKAKGGIDNRDGLGKDPIFRYPRWLMPVLLWLGKTLPSAYFHYRGTVLITSVGLWGPTMFPIGNRNLAFSYGPVEKKAVVVTDDTTGKSIDRIEIRHRMTMTMCIDHRTLEGAPSAQLFKRVKQLIENPPQEWLKPT